MFIFNTNCVTHCRIKINYIFRTETYIFDFDATMCHAIRIEDEHLIITAMRGIGKWQQFYT
jgi:hypothetical protein